MANYSDILRTATIVVAAESGEEVSLDTRTLRAKAISLTSQLRVSRPLGRSSSRFNGQAFHTGERHAGRLEATMAAATGTPSSRIFRVAAIASIRYAYLQDYPVSPLSNIWTDTGCEQFH